jgi:hypothetical protein
MKKHIQKAEQQEQATKANMIGMLGSGILLVLELYYTKNTLLDKSAGKNIKFRSILFSLGWGSLTWKFKNDYQQSKQDAAYHREQAQKLQDSIKP